MGYSTDRLNIPEHLRAWHSAGVEYFYPSDADSFPDAAAAEPESVILTAEWEAILGKSPQSPAVVWTYAELGFDLSGRADSARGKMLRSLIAHLRWPKGSSGFVPTGLPEADAIKHNPAVFWSCVERLEAHTVVCLGSDAADRICPEHDGRASVVIDSVTIHILPSLQELEAMLPHERLAFLDRLSEIHL